MILRKLHEVHKLFGEGNFTAKQIFSALRALRKFPQEYMVSREFNESPKTPRRYTKFLEKELLKQKTLSPRCAR